MVRPSAELRNVRDECCWPIRVCRLRLAEDSVLDVARVFCGSSRVCGSLMYGVVVNVFSAAVVVWPLAAGELASYSYRQLVIGSGVVLGRMLPKQNLGNKRVRIVRRRRTRLHWSCGTFCQAANVFHLVFHLERETTCVSF